MLSLLQNSDLHRNALLKALDKAYVVQNISMEGIDQLVGNIAAGAFIAFSNEEIPSKVKKAPKPCTSPSSVKTTSCHELFYTTVNL